MSLRQVSSVELTLSHVRIVDKFYGVTNLAVSRQDSWILKSLISVAREKLLM